MNKRRKVSVAFVVTLIIIFFLAWGLKNLVLNLTQEFPMKTMRLKVWAPENVFIPSVATGFIGINPCGESSYTDYKDFQSLIKESEVSGIYPTADGTFWYCAQKEGENYSTSTNIINQKEIREKIGERWYGIFLAPPVKISYVSRPELLDSEKATAYANIAIKKENGMYALLIVYNLLFILIFVFSARDAYSEWKDDH